MFTFFHGLKSMHVKPALFVYPTILLITAIMFTHCSNFFTDDAVNKNRTTITIFNTKKATVDKRIFGHFLERPGKKELGVEAAWDSVRGGLRKDVLALLDSMNIPLLRFPGGSVVEYGPEWTNLIDNAPHREEKIRSEGFRFGFDEFMELCNQLQCEPLLAVAAARSLFPWKKETLAHTIEMAQALVAYMNVPLDNNLPKHLKIWPRIRAQNGHENPYNVKLWQIGNEPFLAFGEHLRNTKKFTNGQIRQTYVSIMDTLITAMKSVDSSIAILIEAQMDDNDPPIPMVDTLLAALGDRVDYVTQHLYRPWKVEQILKGDSVYSPDSFTQADFWNAAVAVPDIDSVTGESRYMTKSFDIVKQHPIPLAITEWNWNGWYDKNLLEQNADLVMGEWAKGVGAATFLLAMIKEAQYIKIAAQSMIVGNSWKITGIDIKPDDPEYLYWRPTARVIGLNSRNHGAHLYRSEIKNSPVFSQPFTLTNIKPAKKVAAIDVVVTGGGDSLFIHLVNRDYTRDISVLVNLEGFNNTNKTGTLKILHEKNFKLGAPIIAAEKEVPVSRNNKSLSLTMPARSVGVIIVQLRA